MTGSAGFIGRHLTDALVERGYRVTGVDRQSRFDSGDYEHYILDLGDDPQTSGLLGLMAGADVVFHLAARPGVRGHGSAIQRERYRDNVVATRHLLDVTPPSTALVVTSSSSVYGGSRHGRPCREGDELLPRGGYARSKVIVEQLCEVRRERGGVVTVVRPFTVAGEHQRSDMAFSIWLDALSRGEPIRIFGSPSRSRDITDVRDVVEGLIRAGERGLNRTINLGTGVGYRLIDMARVLMDVYGRETDVVTHPVSAEDVDATLADTTLCQELLGFTPQTDLYSLLARQAAAAARIPAMVAT